MTVTFKFPNDKYIVDLKGSERTTYLKKLRDFYNDLKSKSFPVPSATLKKEGSDDSYLEMETLEQNYISVLFQEGVITEDKARKLSPRVSEILDKIKESEDVTIFNAHTLNVVYNPTTDKLFLVDLTQNSKCSDFNKVKKFSPEYLEKMKQKQLEEEKEEEEAEEKDSDDEETETKEEEDDDDI